MKFVTQAHQKLIVSQLLGTYGVFGISSENYKYECEDLTDKSKSYSSPVMKFDIDATTFDLPEKCKHSKKQEKRELWTKAKSAAVKKEEEKSR